MNLSKVFDKSKLDDKQLNELIGVCRGICADGAVNKGEAEYLAQWLESSQGVSRNPITSNLLLRVHEMLQDNFLDDEESKELLETLKNFSGGEYDLGEITKGSTLPFDEPQPQVTFKNKTFCFAGAFAFGSRQACQKVVEEHGGICVADISDQIDYLVIGIYASGDWIHSTYGNKIKRAKQSRKEGSNIAIIGEGHWLKFI